MQQAARARWAIALLFVMDGIGFGVWAAHIPVFKDTLDLQPSALSKILLALVLGSLSTMPLTGLACARFGSRIVIWIASASYIAAIAILSLVHAFWPLFFVAGFFGASKGALDVSINAQGAWVERNLGKPVISSFQGCWSLGGLLGATASSFVLHHGGTIPVDFSRAAILLFLLTLIGSPFLLPEPSHTGEKQKFRMPDPLLLRLAGIAFLGLFAEGAMADWDGVYLNTSVGVDLSRAAIGYAAFSVAMAAGRFSGDFLLARYRPSRVLLISGALLFLGVTLALTFNTWETALAGFILSGLGVANIVPVVWGAAGRNRVIGSGPALATVTTVGYFGFLAGPPLIGAVATWLTLRTAMFLIALFGIAIAASSPAADRT